MKFLFVSSLGATVLARSRLLEEKKMKAMAQKRSNPPPLLVCFGCFRRRKFVVSLAQKRRKKTSVWLFPLLYIYEGERHKNTTERTTRRTANNKIRILINGDERESLHVIR